MPFILIDKDGAEYIDPFTSKTAKFERKQTAQITAFMLFDQHQREFEVKEK